MNRRHYFSVIGSSITPSIANRWQEQTRTEETQQTDGRPALKKLFLPEVALADIYELNLEYPDVVEVMTDHYDGTLEDLENLITSIVDRSVNEGVTPSEFCNQGVIGKVHSHKDNYRTLLRDLLNQPSFFISFNKVREITPSPNHDYTKELHYDPQRKYRLQTVTIVADRV